MSNPKIKLTFNIGNQSSARVSTTPNTTYTSNVNSVNTSRPTITFTSSYSGSYQTPTSYSSIENTQKYYGHDPYSTAHSTGIQYDTARSTAHSAAPVHLSYLNAPQYNHNAPHMYSNSTPNSSSTISLQMSRPKQTKRKREQKPKVHATPQQRRRTEKIPTTTSQIPTESHHMQTSVPSSIPAKVPTTSVGVQVDPIHTRDENEEKIIDMLKSELVEATKRPRREYDTVLTETDLQLMRRLPKPPPPRTLSDEEHPLVIPACAGWFRMNSVHGLERRYNAEFFNGKSGYKTPETYVKWRNFMIDLYRQNPRVYLTATAARRYLAGDACAILRLHSFLERWGLINFDVDITTVPARIGPRHTTHWPVHYADSMKDTTDSEKDVSTLANATTITASNHVPTNRSTASHNDATHTAVGSNLVQSTTFNKTDNTTTTTTTSATSTTSTSRMIASTDNNLLTANTVQPTDLTSATTSLLQRISNTVKIARSGSARFDSGTYPNTKSTGHKDTWSTHEVDKLMDAVFAQLQTTLSRPHAQDELHPGHPRRLDTSKSAIDKIDWSSIATIVQSKTAEQCARQFLMTRLNDPDFHSATSNTQFAAQLMTAVSCLPQSILQAALNAAHIEFETMVSHISPVDAAIQSNDTESTGQNNDTEQLNDKTGEFIVQASSEQNLSKKTLEKLVETASESSSMIVGGCLLLQAAKDRATINSQGKVISSLLEEIQQQKTLLQRAKKMELDFESKVNEIERQYAELQAFKRQHQTKFSRE